AASLDGEGNPDVEWRRILESAGALWTAELPVDLDKLFALQGPGLRIPLPGYAFQRKRYWLDAVTAQASAPRVTMDAVEEPDDVPSSTPSNASPAELRVIAIMRELLGSVHLGRNSDFFLSGGDSLMAVRLAARIGDAFGIRPTRSQIMKGRTPARIAALLEEGGASKQSDEKTDDCLMRLWRGNDRLPPIVLVHAVGGGVFTYQEFLQAPPASGTTARPSTA
ncbi:MAG: phosphopantetheine-binding protein, partial [Opitutaceae bacterium]